MIFLKVEFSKSLSSALFIFKVVDHLVDHSFISCPSVYLLFCG